MKIQSFLLHRHMHIVEVIQSYWHSIEKTLDNICKEKLRFIESQEHARE